MNLFKYFFFIGLHPMIGTTPVITVDDLPYLHCLIHLLHGSIDLIIFFCFPRIHPANRISEGLSLFIYKYAGASL